MKNTLNFILIVLVLVGIVIFVRYLPKNSANSNNTVGENIISGVEENPSNSIGSMPTDGIVVDDFEGEADPSRMTLGMTTWVWQKTLYNDGRVVMPNKKNAFTLKFDEKGNISITTDCNSGGGFYSAKDGMLSFKEIYSTQMYCEGSQESEFVSMIQNSTGYTFTSRGELVLDLKFDSGSVVFR